jgi:hypothetical protein
LKEAHWFRQPDGITRSLFLVEPDGGVDEEQADDIQEILPVQRAATTVGKGDGNKSSGFS